MPSPARLEEQHPLRPGPYRALFSLPCSPFPPTFTSGSPFRPPPSSTYSACVSPPRFSLYAHKMKWSPAFSPWQPPWPERNEWFLAFPFSQATTTSQCFTFAGRRRPGPVSRGIARQSCGAVEGPALRTRKRTHSAKRWLPVAAHVHFSQRCQSRTSYGCKRQAHARRLIKIYWKMSNPD